MKLLIPIILLSLFSFSFINKDSLQTDKNGLTVKEFISFFENRATPDAVDKEIGKKNWIYVSSEKHGTTQVDMWMFENLLPQCTVYYAEYFFASRRIANQPTSITFPTPSAV